MHHSQKCPQSYKESLLTPTKSPCNKAPMQQVNLSSLRPNTPITLLQGDTIAVDAQLPPNVIVKLHPSTSNSFTVSLEPRPTKGLSKRILPILLLDVIDDFLDVPITPEQLPSARAIVSRIQSTPGNFYLFTTKVLHGDSADPTILRITRIA